MQGTQCRLRGKIGAILLYPGLVFDTKKIYCAGYGPPKQSMHNPGSFLAKQSWH